MFEQAMDILPSDPGVALKTAPTPTDPLAKLKCSVHFLSAGSVAMARGQIARSARQVNMQPTPGKKWTPRALSQARRALGGTIAFLL